ncbi:hypothetical protein TUM4438_45880 [Shewanella sairae]|uniref:Plasmid replication protein RepL domain-containing protein n=1 Tax=Shewanella sairae TaxID=190310 RepID=A0ABQ4PRX0_9GAMM|nr:replication/maintenance protein RepL [Shewanella sairae]MCL1132640.1 replication/maintenance protein RepL [Shewanella sairae]GIU52647.1 hypothetical protein TUM4438_45880 [Shewanella sairae]
MKSTSKKTKVIGVKRYLDQETGEILDMSVVETVSTDFNFEKIWLMHIMQALDCMGSKKIKVVTWLLANKDHKNTIIGTQRAIAEKAEVSLPIVTKTLKTLIESDIIKMVQNGVYMLNPDVMFKGDNKQRMNILIKYNKL